MKQQRSKHSNDVSGFGTVALILLTSACAPEFDDDLSQVTSARVVAVQAIPAEASEEDEVALSALIVAPAAVDDGKLSWALCIQRKPLTELGAVAPQCLDIDAGDEVLDELGSGLSVTSIIPKNACRLFGPLGSDAKPGEPAGRPIDPDPTGGFYQPVVNWLSAADAAVSGVRLDCGLAGVGREDLVEYRDRYRKNQNPEILELELARENGESESIAADASVRVKVGETVRFVASWQACPRKSKCGDGVCGTGEDQLSCADDCREPKGCTGAESYVWLDPEEHTIEERREGLALSWYTTGGVLDEERTGVSETDPDDAKSSNVWVAPTTPGSVKQWLVIQDARGGASWRSFQIEVVP
jgi:hypothetical protein